MTELALFLDGEPAGLLRQSATGNVTFEYDGDYSASASATPLSLSMPLERRTHPSRAVLPFLEGLLPDSADRRNALAREHGVSAGNPFALLSHIGRDAAGAVQILPAGESSPDAARRQGDVELLDDDRFAEVVADVIANRDVWGRRELSVRWSLPGAQPKIALFRSRDQLWGVPNDSTPTTHIIKPAVPPYPDHHLNEFMTMAAARHLGLDVANDTMIVTTRGDAAFVSERYDRVTVGTRWVRLHQEDLCQSMAVLPQKKYQVDGGPSVRQIARLFRSLPDAQDRVRNAERFYDALVFSLASQGTDAHAKNYSLLLEGDHARLAPLYDLGSHAPYPTRGAALTLAMSIDDEYRIHAIGTDALVRAAGSLGLDAEYARDRVGVITAGVVDAFDRAADEARAVIGPHMFIDRLLDGIASWAEERGWR